MSKESQIIDTKSLYVNPDRGVATLNYSQNYFTDIPSLINSDEEGRDTGSFIGDSYRDLTRIANINEDLWSELFFGNKKNLLESIDNFLVELNNIRNSIVNEEEEELKSLFIKSSKRREKL